MQYWYQLYDTFDTVYIPTQYTFRIQVLIKKQN